MPQTLLQTPKEVSWQSSNAKMTIVLSFLAGALIGFVAGALVFRNNANKINSGIASAQSKVNAVVADVKK